MGQTERVLDAPDDPLLPLAPASKGGEATLGRMLDDLARGLALTLRPLPPAVQQSRSDREL